MRLTVIPLLLCLFLMAGCAAAEIAQAEPDFNIPAADEQLQATATPDLAPEAFDPSAFLLGFLVKDSSSFESMVAVHAFLRNAENIGYPSRVYVGPEGAGQAAKDGCAGLLLQDGVSADLQALRAAGCKFVTLGSEPDADVILYEDVADYSGEIARAMGEELIKRKAESGSVLVIPGVNGEAAARAFMDAFAKGYPQFTARIQTAGMLDEERVASVKQLVGIYCVDPTAAEAWAQARDTAEKELKPSPTPKLSSTPKPTPKPSASIYPTPAPTLAPHQAVRNVVIIATDYSPRNLELLQSDSIYAIVAQPYFDAAAQGTFLLDRLLRGVQTPDKTRLNVPIVRKSGLDKYQSIVGETMAWMSPESK